MSKKLLLGLMLVGWCNVAYAWPDEDCRKTTTNGSPTIECTLSWFEIDQLIYDTGLHLMTAIHQSGTPLNYNSAFFLTGHPDNDHSIWIVNWFPTYAGAWAASGIGNILFIIFGQNIPYGWPNAEHETDEYLGFLP